MSAGSLGLRQHGFDGPVDYIERITYDIWNLPYRQPGLIARYYGPDTVIHLDSGDLVGDSVVIENTLVRLRTFPDFHGVIDDTIWTGSEDTGYRTSMRWTWSGTDTGGTAHRPPTGRRVSVMAIANCLVRGQLITEEWLAVNPMSQLRQLGVDLVESDVLVRYPRSSDRLPMNVTGRPPIQPTPAGQAVTAVMSGALAGEVPLALVHPDCLTATAADRQWTGREFSGQWGQTVVDGLGPTSLHVDDQYELTEPGPAVRVATQGRLRGGGPAEPVDVTIVAHHHVEAGVVTAQWLAFDELLLSQYRAGARTAGS